MSQGAASGTLERTKGLRGCWLSSNTRGFSLSKSRFTSYHRVHWGLCGRAFVEARSFHLLAEQPLFLPERAWLRRTSTAVCGLTKEG